MTCFHPLVAYRAEGGRITLVRGEGFSDRPLSLPCGQCLGCRAARARAWALRCVHEASLHRANCFVTLTYSPQHLPATCSLDREELRLFWRRLRKARGSVRYFACGEYGESNLRPHYHAILFGQDFSDDRVEVGKGLFSSPSLEKVWGKGFVTLGDVTFGSAAYVAQYCMKKVKSDDRYERVDGATGEVFSVLPEFAVMSRRPGIGRDWYERFRGDVFPEDEVVFEGRKFKVPRYYAALYEAEDPEGFERVKARRLDAMSERADDNTLSRMEVKEEAAKIALRAKARRL